MKLDDAKKELVVTRPDDEKQTKALHGLTRSLLANMVEGVTNGYKKTLEIQGVGYKAEQKGKNIVLSVGYANTITVPIPRQRDGAARRPNKIHVTGADKQAVGQFAAEVRARSASPSRTRARAFATKAKSVKIKPGKAFAGAGSVIIILDCSVIFGRSALSTAGKSTATDMADKNKDKTKRLERRKWSIRNSLSGTPERPRLSVFRSDKHIYAQLIDDYAGKTLAAVSSTAADVRGDLKNGGNIAAAKKRRQGDRRARQGRRHHEGRVRSRRPASITAASRPWPTRPAKAD